MQTSFSLFVGLRYTASKRSNRFVSLVSLVSLLGMVLGVFALIVVLSVMNGFGNELRSRILSLIPHAYVAAPARGLDDWQSLRDQLQQHPRIQAAAPYIDGNVMLARNHIVRSAHLYAVDPAAERAVSQIARLLLRGQFDALASGSYRVVLGELLAQSMGVDIGSQLTLILPQVTVTPLGIFPRSKVFTVAGIFRAGSQLDSDTVFIHLDDGRKLFQLGQRVSGLRLHLDDLFAADAVAGELNRDWSQDDTASLTATSWSQSQGSLFRAIKMEKTMMTLLLLIIVAIAAFNIVSILTMMVADKHSDIAVLRTMGASPGQIMAIFVVQGLAIAALGVALGVLFAVPAALNAGEIAAWLENLIGARIFNPDVYFITRIPSQLQWSDVYLVATSAMLLSLLATLYPAWRAAQIQPAEVLRYE